MSTRALGQSIDTYFKQAEEDLLQIVQDSLLVDSGRPHYSFSEEHQDTQQEFTQCIQTQLNEELNGLSTNESMQLVFKTPVYLTAVVFGIMSPLVTWQEWKYNALWEKYAQFDFHDMYQRVNQIICDFVLHNNVSFQKQKVK